MDFVMPSHATERGPWQGCRKVIPPPGLEARRRPGYLWAMTKCIAAATLAALAILNPAAAQAAPELIGLFDDWEAYTATEAGA